MTIVAVAGGLGDLGRLISDALFETGKHEVYIMSRKAVQDKSTRTSPLTGKLYIPFIQNDYTSEESLMEQFEKHNIKVIICTFIMDSNAASDSQLRLIRAAERCDCVTRFMPSEFNVEYNVGNDIFPFPEKEFHLAGRRELEKTKTLEYAYIYPGMFMDYFGLPKVKSNLRPLCFCIDPAHGKAILPGDGQAKMSMTFSTDAARYVALSLELQKWPRIMTTVTSTVTLNELVRLVEACQGSKLDVQYQSVQRLLRHETTDLPTNLEIAKQYPERFAGGLGELRELIADLEAGIALGAYDLEKVTGHLDLVKLFEGGIPEPRRLQDVIEEGWKVGST